MKSSKRKKHKQSGQSLVEFLIVVMVILVLLFAFIQLAWALGWGHYVHYSTFMASRAYYSADTTVGDQLANAQSVLQKMVKKPGGAGDMMEIVAQARTGDERDIVGAEPVAGAFIGTHPTAAETDLTTRSFSWAEGVQYNFQFRLFILPFASWLRRDRGKTIEVGDREGGERVTWNGKIGLTSDSFLGREISTEECVQFMQDLPNAAGIAREDGAEFLYDNGC